MVDTLRIVLANIESDLARRLAPHLDRPREAKKALATLLAAPGWVRLAGRGAHVTLAPTATPSERAGFAALLRELRRAGLTLPGDPGRRPLRFRLK